MNSSAWFPRLIPIKKLITDSWIFKKKKLFFLNIQAIRSPSELRNNSFIFEKGGYVPNWTLQITPKTKQIRSGVRVKFGNLTP